MAISAGLGKLISDQIALELRAFRFYLLAANVAAKLGFDTFGQWLRSEAKDEGHHAIHWTKLAEDMGIFVDIIPGPVDTRPESLEKCITEAVQLEELLLTHMEAIHAQADKESCGPVEAFLINGRKGYEPLTHQQKSITEWQQMADRLKTENIADIEASLKH
jgi:ferritin